MDDKNLNIENNNVYRAMPNMNTAIENPDVDLTGVMDVNIKDVNNDFGVNNSNSQINIGNSIINHEIQMANEYNNQETMHQSNIYMNSVDQSNNINNNFNNNQVNLEPVVNQNVSFMEDVDKKVDPNLGVQENVNISNNNIVTQVNESNVKEVYKPTFKSKTKPKKGLVIPKELVVLIVIVGILLLFLFVMPYIYEFFRNLNF